MKELKKGELIIIDRKVLVLDELPYYKQSSSNKETKDTDNDKN